MDGFDVFTVESGGARLRVFACGQGPPLVLLPGIGRPPADLAAFAGLLVQAGYRALLPEPRGIGQSNGPLEGITLHELAADVAAAMDADSASGAVVIGHAFGNRVARALAVDRPDLVRAVVLLSASGKVHGSAKSAEWNRLALDASADPQERRAAAAAAWFGPGADVTPWLTGWCIAQREAFAQAARATPLSEWWSAGSAQVLIVLGGADASSPPQNGYLLKEEIGPRAKLLELPGIGHSLPVEAPAALAQAVLPTLSEFFGLEVPHTSDESVTPSRGPPAHASMRPNTDNTSSSGSHSLKTRS